MALWCHAAIGVGDCALPREEGDILQPQERRYLMVHAPIGIVEIGVHGHDADVVLNRFPY